MKKSRIQNSVQQAFSNWYVYLNCIIPIKIKCNFLTQFRFSDRVDKIILSIGIFAAIFHSFCYVAYLTLLAEMTSLFAEKSFLDSCGYLMKNHSIINTFNHRNYSLSLSSIHDNNLTNANKFHNKIINSVYLLLSILNSFLYT